MGRLPIQGVGWYRRKLQMLPEDQDKSIYLDIGGAMSYAMVWLNGELIGGWPYPYNSFRLDLTPYLTPGNNNQLAIRLENPTESSRWYPGGGIYRNVWLTKVNRVHVAQWGTYITLRDVSAHLATVNAVVQVQNTGNASQQVVVITDVHEVDSAAGQTGRPGAKVASFESVTLNLPPGETQQVNSSVEVQNPKLWGPYPSQNPNLYVAITRLHQATEESNDIETKTIDTYETQFGIRSIVYDSNNGLLVNGKHVKIQGVNQHHDLGALGAAFNNRAAERQLEVLQELGCNAI